MTPSAAPRRRQPRAAPSDPPRSAAYDVLAAVREKDAYANLVLPPLLRSRGITGRDAAFATELVSGTIRRQGTYDAVLTACVNRPLAKVDVAVLDALRLGAHQVLAMRVPTHAAVATTVDLVRVKVGHGPAGFTNAVLRTVAAHSLSEWVRRVAPDPARDPIGFAVVAHSHPRWVVDALAAALAAAGSGEPDAAGLYALLAADNEPPKVTLVARPGQSTVEELVAAGGVPGDLSPWAARLTGGDPGAVPAVAQGRAGVQDEGSQLMALTLVAASVDGPDEESPEQDPEQDPEQPAGGRDTRWLDLCAGPGGKAALLAALAGERGARVLAAERLEHRAGLVAAATVRSGPGLLGVVTVDGTVPAWAPGSFDRVLVDAPCSGLGALRRRPESRWRRSATDVPGLVVLQQALLGSALDAVRVGGVVAYVTCSPVLAETAGVVRAVLAERDDVRLEDAVPLLGVQDAAGPLPGTVQLWPHRHGTDAMFLALLRRVRR